MAKTVLTLDCWRKGCDFHEMLEGHNDLVDKHVVFASSNELWAEHNRKVHGRG